MKRFAAVLLLLTLASTSALSQSATTAKSVREQFTDINRKILDMAKDFPEDKYDFKLKPDLLPLCPCFRQVSRLLSGFSLDVLEFSVVEVSFCRLEFN